MCVRPNQNSTRCIFVHNGDGECLCTLMTLECAQYLNCGVYRKDTATTYRTSINRAGYSSKVIFFLILYFSVFDLIDLAEEKKQNIRNITQCAQCWNPEWFVSCDQHFVMLIWTYMRFVSMVDTIPTAIFDKTELIQIVYSPTSSSYSRSLPRTKLNQLLAHLGAVQ